MPEELSEYNKKNYKIILSNKMKNKIYHTVETVLKCISKIVEINKINTSNTQIQVTAHAPCLVQAFQSKVSGLNKH